MQQVRILNLAAVDVNVQGFPGAIPAGTAVTGFIDTFVYDANYDAYQNRTPEAGVAILDLDSASPVYPSAYLALTAPGTIILDDRIVEVTNSTGAASVVTMPLAAAVPAGDIIYIINKSTSTGALTLTRAGSDKIDGGNTLNCAIGAIKRLKSDGVANFTSV